MTDYILKKWEFILIVLLMLALIGIVALSCQIERVNKSKITIKKI